jgi:uncharacterized membrane protein YhaH (DUF805 family)
MLYACLRAIENQLKHLTVASEMKDRDVGLRTQSTAQLRWLLFSFRGRISPKVWLVSNLLLVIFSTLILIILRGFLPEPGASLSSSDSVLGLIVLSVLLLNVWISWALALKRLHDYGRSWGTLFGVVVLLLFVPVMCTAVGINPILTLIVLCALMMQPGKSGPNKYAAGQGWWNSAHSATT